MTGRHKLHDATGVIASDEAGNKLLVVEDLGSAGGDAPADGSVGYAKGCIIINSGAADDDDDVHIFINLGSATDSNIDGLKVQT
jgi:dihydroxyacetone kinase DhaKLM complex PTS-EIIA-like component DhaM